MPDASGRCSTVPFGILTNSATSMIAQSESSPPPLRSRILSIATARGRRWPGSVLQIEAGEIFVFLGPNGGGKTTLFRVALDADSDPARRGPRCSASICAAKRKPIRERIGVVFQAPSLDKKLTVAENLMHQGHLYGLPGDALRARQRRNARASGARRPAPRSRRNALGRAAAARRVGQGNACIARGCLLLDEPSTGLDPGARSDLWDYLQQVRRDEGVTIVLTTHLLEEAEKADRIAILNEGSLVALDTPEALQATVGGDSITIQTDAGRNRWPTRSRPASAVRRACVEGAVRLEQPDGHEWIARLVEAFPGRIEAITLGKPTLEDVFIDRTGHRFWHEREEVAVG